MIQSVELSFRKYLILSIRSQLQVISWSIELLQIEETAGSHFTVHWSTELWRRRTAFGQLAAFMGAFWFCFLQSDPISAGAKLSSQGEMAGGPVCWPMLAPRHAMPAAPYCALVLRIEKLVSSLVRVTNCRDGTVQNTQTSVPDVVDFRTSGLSFAVSVL